MYTSMAFCMNDYFLGYTIENYTNENRIPFNQKKKKNSFRLGSDVTMKSISIRHSKPIINMLLTYLPLKENNDRYKRRVSGLLSFKETKQLNKVQIWSSPFFYIIFDWITNYRLTIILEKKRKGIKHWFVGKSRMHYLLPLLCSSLSINSTILWIKPSLGLVITPYYSSNFA